MKCVLSLLVDGTISSSSGTIEQLLVNFNINVVEGHKLGLVVNARKHEVITDDINITAEFKSVAPDIKHVEDSSVMLLSASIGDKTALMRC
jgi:hypothetical protein